MLLTALTQLGGVAWLIALGFKRRLLAFVLAYCGLFTAALVFAPQFGRVALPCFDANLRAQSVFYCATMRNYVSPQMAQVAQKVADSVAQNHPGTVTLYLDGNLPFWDGFPLLPHVSHDDGNKLDLAFYYVDEAGAYAVGKCRSAIGYWAFEQFGQEQCPEVWPTMRWSLPWLQGLWPDRDLEPERTKTMVEAVLSDPRVSKLFLEPDLARRLGVAHSKMRFQGCRAARHDDHLHLQL